MENALNIKYPKFNNRIYIFVFVFRSFSGNDVNATNTIDI